MCRLCVPPHQGRLRGGHWVLLRGQWCPGSLQWPGINVRDFYHWNKKIKSTHASPMSLKTAIEIKSKQPPKSFSGCICLSMFKAYGFNSFRSMLMAKKKALHKAISPRDLPCCEDELCEILIKVLNTASATGSAGR